MISLVKVTDPSSRSEKTKLGNEEIPPVKGEEWVQIGPTFKKVEERMAQKAGEVHINRLQKESTIQDHGQDPEGSKGKGIEPVDTTPPIGEKTTGDTPVNKNLAEFRKSALLEPFRPGDIPPLY